MIKTVFLDMGNVLVLFSHERMCAQIATLCARPTATVQSALIESGLQHEFELGRVNEVEFGNRLGSALQTTFDRDQLRQASSDIFELNVPLLALLDQVQQNATRLVLLSNTSIAHFEFIRDRFDVLDRFDDFVLSFQVGALKPHSQIFNAALELAECPAEECFFTDDLRENVEQARRMGMVSEVFTSPVAFEQQMRKLHLV